MQQSDSSNPSLAWINAQMEQLSLNQSTLDWESAAELHYCEKCYGWITSEMTNDFYYVPKPNAYWCYKCQSPA